MLFLLILLKNLSTLFEVYMKNFFFAINFKTCVGLFFCTGRHHASFNQAQKNSLFFPRFIVIRYLHTFVQFTKTGEIVCWYLLPGSFERIRVSGDLLDVSSSLTRKSVCISLIIISHIIYMSEMLMTFQSERKNYFLISHLFP